ncbi:hypothetical protein LRP30_33575 [Bradyrhizobium sp. C-145]|uniref:hypothetical protein n=1 Tax=Bradyrhizobium sp. C-145 TaxID=574727 RepID=UPI00201B890A|nr:hypothetical protein [Bradyrhizobium sp. C-145]UQR68262.1 hypothetical protein LRP30_33575 [Bradyrhizobium sp. C-145]
MLRASDKLFFSVTSAASPSSHCGLPARSSNGSARAQILRIGRQLFDEQTNAPIIDEQILTGINGCEYFRMRLRDRLLPARPFA